MPLNKLENFIRSVDGRTIYVNPTDINATDSITNQGTSMTQPFKSIQRALLESARFSYIRGDDNDLIEQTTIKLFPGTHYIDNRPGYGIRIDEVSGDAVAVSPGGAEIPNPLEFFNLTTETNFEVRSKDNTVWHYNSIYGGVIIPRGTSIVGIDLRKTRIVPSYIPNPTDPFVDSSAIFRLTGGCYLNQFTVFDGDVNTTVYTDSRDFSVNNQSVPTFSHNKLTAFEFADGVNVPNGFQLTDLNMYYSKLSNAYNVESTRPIDEKYPEDQQSFTSRLPEFQIVGAFATDPIQISNLISGDGFTASSVITVTTLEPHGLDTGTPIKIRGVSVSDYNISTQVVNVIDVNNFTYSLSFVRANLPASPSVSGSNVTVEVDTVTGSSPYIFNVSLRSVWGMNGLKADGSNTTGFRSMVVSQFTAISLQKDDRAFVKYNEQSRRYDGIDVSAVVRGSELSSQSSSTNTSTVYHLDPQAQYRPGWGSKHIYITNDSVMQIVSVFAIGFDQQFVTENGGDASLTNSNSNFGQNSLSSIGFKAVAFGKDDQGFVSHIITPKTVFNPSVDTVEQVRWVNFDFDAIRAAASSNQLFLSEYDDVEVVPPAIVGEFRVGANSSDSIKQPLRSGGTLEAIPVMSDSLPGSSSPIGTSVGMKSFKAISITSSIIEFDRAHNLVTAEKVRILSLDGDLPENIAQDSVYYAIVDGLNNNQIKIATSEANAANSLSLEIYGSGTHILVESRVNDKDSGEPGHPVQWDETRGQWYLLTEDNSPLYQYIITTPTATDNTKFSYFERVSNTRSLDDSVYRLRYVIPSSAVNSKPPTPGYIIQESSFTGARTNADFSINSITASDYAYNKNPRFIADASVDIVSSSLVFTSELPHNLNVGDTVKILNIRSTNNPTGNFDSGYNGNFIVTRIDGSKVFRTSNIDILDFGRQPGTFTSDINDRTVLLPRFECSNNQANLYVYRVDTITPLTEGIRDGIYHLYVINSSNRVTETFIEKSYGQPIEYYYPQIDSDNIDENPQSTHTFANRSPLGKVTVNNIQNSITRESIDKYIRTGNQNIITTFNDLGTIVEVNFEVDHTFNGVYGYSSLTPGSGYTDGTYYNVPLFESGGIDKNTTAKVTISGGSVVDLEIMDPGSGYSVPTTLTVGDSSPGVVNATITVDNTCVVINDGMIVQVIGGGALSPSFYTYVESVSSSSSLRLNYPASYSRTDLAGMIVVPIDSSVLVDSTSFLNGTTRITTTGTIRSGYLVGQSVLLFDGSGNDLGVYYVTRVRETDFDVYTGTDLGTIARVGKTGMEPNDAFTGSGNEHIGIRGMFNYAADTLEAVNIITNSSTTIEVSSREAGVNTILARRLQLGQYIQINSEIMRVSSTTFTGPNSNVVSVLRGVLGTNVSTHHQYSRIRLIDPLAIELRRPSILRASAHTFEYLGYGPGNYSTSLPQLQVEQLPQEEVFLAQSQKLSAGQVVYTGMSDSGDFYVGNIKYSSASGEQQTFGVPNPSFAGNPDSASTTTLENLVVKSRLVVEGGPNQTTQSQFDGPVRFNSSVSMQTDLSIAGDLTISGDLNLDTVLELNGLQVNGNVDISKDTKIDGDLDVDGNINVGLELRYEDPTGNEYVAIQGPDVGMTTSYAITLPSDAPIVGGISTAGGTVLVSDSNGVTKWENYYNKSNFDIDFNLALGDSINNGDQIGIGVTYDNNSNAINFNSYIPTTTTTSKTLITNEFCTVDTTQSITLTLPLSPEIGDRVTIGVYEVDDGVFVARNGELIMGIDEDLIINLENVNIQMIYISSSLGWKIC